MSAQAAALPADKMQACSYDFQAALTVLKEKENSKWRHLVEDSGDQSYPVLLGTTAESFRNDVRDQLTPLLRQTLPSLADSEKPDPGAA